MGNVDLVITDDQAALARTPQTVLRSSSESPPLSTPTTAVRHLRAQAPLLSR